MLKIFGYIHSHASIGDIRLVHSLGTVCLEIDLVGRNVQEGASITLNGIDPLDPENGPTK